MWISNLALGILGLLMLYLLSDTRGEPILYRLSMVATLVGCWWAILNRSHPDTAATTLFSIGVTGVSFFLAKSTRFVTRFNIRHALCIVSTIRSMEQIVSILRCDRIIAFVAVKDLGRLRPGCRIYAISGSSGPDGQPDEWLDYQGTQMDEHYVRLLETAIKKGNSAILVNEIEFPSGGPSVLENIYRAKRIRYAELYAIRDSRADFLFLSIGYKQIPGLTSANRNDIINLVQQIKNTWNTKGNW